VTGYAERRDDLARSLRGTRDGGPLRLAKSTSNLFRDRDSAPRRRLDVRGRITSSRRLSAGWTPKR
jgi:hypothetical protein